MPFAKPQRIQPETLRHKIYQVICDSIVSGHLRPGEALVESTIAEHLGVSRVPVREAFYLLEKNGYVRMIPHKGAFVTNMSRKEIEDILELREMLESAVICDASRKLLPGDFERLDQVVEEMEKAAASRDYVQFYAKDMEFHSYIWHCKGNRKIEETLHSICASFVAFVMMIYASGSQNLETPLASHRRLLQLLKETAGPEELRQWVQTHLATGRDLTLRFAASRAIGEDKSSAENPENREEITHPQQL